MAGAIDQGQKRIWDGVEIEWEGGTIRMGVGASGGEQARDLLQHHTERPLEPERALSNLPLSNVLQKNSYCHYL